MGFILIFKGFDISNTFGADFNFKEFEIRIYFNLDFIVFEKNFHLSIFNLS